MMIQWKDILNGGGLWEAKTQRHRVMYWENDPTCEARAKGGEVWFIECERWDGQYWRSVEGSAWGEGYIDAEIRAKAEEWLRKVEAK
jgi:hypothetical protein